MNPREEIAHIIASFQSDTQLAQEDLNCADAILAAGYRKPRTITTLGDLYALPTGSIIRDPDGTVGELHDGPNSNFPRVIFWIGNECEDDPRADLNLPATVLYVPERTER